MKKFGLVFDLTNLLRKRSEGGMIAKPSHFASGLTVMTVMSKKPRATFIGNRRVK